MGRRDTSPSIHPMFWVLVPALAACPLAQADTPAELTTPTGELCASVDKRPDAATSLLGSDVVLSCESPREPLRALDPPLPWLAASEGAPLSGSEPQAVSVPASGAAAESATLPWIANATESLHGNPDSEEPTELSALAPRLASRLPEPTSASIAFSGLVMLAAMALRRRPR